MEEKNNIEGIIFGKNKVRNIVKVECSKEETFVCEVFIEDGKKKIHKGSFYPFLWCKRSVLDRISAGQPNFNEVLKSRNIAYTELKTANGDIENTRLVNGYNILFYSTIACSYNNFIKFFEEVDKSSNNKTIDFGNDDYIVLSPTEQYMIKKDMRCFSAYEDYDNLSRLFFQITTSSKNPKEGYIEKIAIATNRGFSKEVITTNGNDIETIATFFSFIKQHSPEVIVGYNTSWQWDFIEERVKNVTQQSLHQFSMQYLRKGIRRYGKKGVKIGSSIEQIKITEVWGYNNIDILLSLKKEMAVNKDIESADIKDFYRYISKDDNTDEDVNLLDMINAIDLRLNQTYFFLSKIIPSSYENVLTMGVSTMWKLILLSASYQNGVAIPSVDTPKNITGGLSRIFSCGAVGESLNQPMVAKLDYNSFYPSIILSIKKQPSSDKQNIILPILSFFYNKRHEYTALANKVKEKDTSAKEEEQKKQRELNTLQATAQSFKLICNSLYGSLINKSFYWNDYSLGEKITFAGRMYFRLLLKKFSLMGNTVTEEYLEYTNTKREDYNYKPIIGDSFAEDTPLFIKYKNNGLIDIKPIKELVDESRVVIDEFGREYDIEDKNYYVLARSGWTEPEYIYRHKTDKDLYKITDSESSMEVVVTKDHSLFNDKQKKITPKDISENTRLEYYKEDIKTGNIPIEKEKCIQYAIDWLEGNIDRVPIDILNADEKSQELFYQTLIFNHSRYSLQKPTKCFLAGMQFVLRRLQKVKE